jgi:predicted GIY-YIG superfamily endonuclease
MPSQGVLPTPPVITSRAVRDGFHYTFWVYILASRTGTLYVGITGYIDRRISQHKMDSIEGFTKNTKYIAGSTTKPTTMFRQRFAAKSS